MRKTAVFYLVSIFKILQWINFVKSMFMNSYEFCSFKTELDTEADIKDVVMVD